MCALLIVAPGDRAAYAEALPSGADAVVADAATAAPSRVGGPALYVRLPPLDGMSELIVRGEICPHPAARGVETTAPGLDVAINGRPAPSDAYVYIIEVICINAQVIALKGDVTLIR